MRTRSFFMKLFISFVCLTVVPVSIIFWASNYRIVADSNEVIGLNCVKNLQTADKAVKQLKDSLSKDCLSLARNDNVSRMAVYGTRFDLTDGEEMLDIRGVLDTMVKTAEMDDNYYSVYLYIENFPYFFTTNQDMVSKENMQDIGWMEYYKKYKEQKIPVSFTETHALNFSTGGMERVSPVYVTTYIYPLMPYTTSLKGAVVVNLKETSISKMVNSEGNSGGSVLILNEQGDVVSSVDRGLLSQNIARRDYVAKILGSGDQSGHFPQKIDATDYLVSYYKSETNGWIYIGTAPVSTLVDNQKTISQDMAAVSLIIIILGILTAYLVTKRIYSPVETMLTTIKSNKMAGRTENEDEFSTIYKALSAISKSDWNQKENAVKKLRENGIIRLICDDIPDEDSKTALGDYFPYDRFLCAVISIDRYDETTENYEEKRWGYIKTLLLELAEETVGEKYKSLGCTVKKGEIAMVFNLSGRQCEDCPKNIRAGFEAFQEEVAKILDNSVTVGIGSCCAYLPGIRKAYIEAETAMNQKMKLGPGKIIVWDDDLNSSTYYYPFETEEKIRNFLVLGKKEALTAEVEKLTEDLKTRPKLSCENITQIATQLAGNTLIKYMIEQHVNPNDVYGVRFNIYSEFARMDTCDEIKSILIEKYSALIEYSEKRKAGGQKENVGNIIEYIRGNYRKDIGIIDISEHVGLSYSHVRKVFKDEIGMSIVDYINAIRIREAKVMLTNKDMSVKSIATALGYNTDQSFERYFKKIVGTTPGEYRSRVLCKKDGAGGPPENSDAPH